MLLFTTHIQAIDPKTGNMTTWSGPDVPAISFSDAQDYCERNGLGYCKVAGQLMMRIPFKSETFTPDWDKAIDYEAIGLN